MGISVPANCVRASPAIVLTQHHDITKWKDFPHYCPFVQGNHQSLVDSLHKGTVMLTFDVSLLSVKTNSWTNTWLMKLVCFLPNFLWLSRIPEYGLLDIHNYSIWSPTYPNIYTAYIYIFVLTELISSIWRERQVAFHGWKSFKCVRLSQ